MARDDGYLCCFVFHLQFPKAVWSFLSGKQRWKQFYAQSVCSCEKRHLNVPHYNLTLTSSSIVPGRIQLKPLAIVYKEESSKNGYVKWLHKSKNQNQPNLKYLNNFTFYRRTLQQVLWCIRWASKVKRVKWFQLLTFNSICRLKWTFETNSTVTQTDRLTVSR